MTRERDRRYRRWARESVAWICWSKAALGHRTPCPPTPGSAGILPAFSINATALTHRTQIAPCRPPTCGLLTSGILRRNFSGRICGGAFVHISRYCDGVWGGAGVRVVGMERPAANFIGLCAGGADCESADAGIARA